MDKVLTRFEREFGLTVNEEGKITTNSLKVAEYYVKDHADVLKKIRKFIKLIPALGQGNFTESSYINEQGKHQPMYEMDRQGFSMLVNKFSGDEATVFTYRYTQAFEEMAEEIIDKREYVQQITDKVKEDKILTLDGLNKIRFSTGRTIKTFASADMKTIDDLVKDFNEYVSGMDATTRITRSQSAIDGIIRLHNGLISDNPGNVGHCYNLKQLIIEVKDYQHKIENKRHGGEKAAKTKQIMKLKQKNEQLEPDIGEYYELPVHGFSENDQYIANNDNVQRDRVCTESYIKWMSNFPTIDMPKKEELQLDWTKKIKIFLAFDYMEKFDVQNLHKSSIDYIFRHYAYDDRLVKDAVIKTNKIVDSFNQGKIYFLLRNV